MQHKSKRCAPNRRANQRSNRTDQPRPDIELRYRFPCWERVRAVRGQAICKPCTGRIHAHRDDKERSPCGEAKADYTKRVRHERGLRDE